MVIITEYNEQDDIPPSSSPVEEVKDKNATKAIEENKKGLQAPNIGNGLDLDNYSCGQSVQEVKVANNATEAIEENKKGHLAPTIGNGLDLDNYSCSQSVQEVKEANNATEVLEENKKGPLAPNIDNGLDLDNYCWGQSLQEVYVNITVPRGTKSRFIVCDIKRNHLTVGLKGQPPILDGELYGPVKVEACFWTLEDQKSISLLLTKIDQMNWWKWVVKGEPELDTEKVEQITSLSELDPETRSSVETVMFDQRQEAMGLPTLDEMQNQEMEKLIMEKYPWMDFSRAKKS
ncbi:hypothetical protein EJD97_005461 [Solanum chilense]|uniref:CS domain-containing protein n=1 Tax=Solanum chilense TaxID=4083 RepID=A0A6N2ALH9_SOLCI|nr:hypothetical protein EJD97_005461 [Solanum chilense]